MSAVVRRNKRKTAGLRMTALVGEAQDQDDEFWGHDTWAVGEDSGNESFRDSDEDSELKKDEFDSDFNESESDNEDEEKAAGEKEERDLQRQERSRKGGGGNYVDVVASKKKGRGKRIVGDGINAGIVLNFHPQIAGSAAASSAATTQQHQPAPVAPVAAAAAPPKTIAKKPAKRISLASTRERRSQSITNRLRENRSTAPTSAPIRKTGKTGSKKPKRRLYTQEELLLEAVHETETENQRWLLARKRVKDAELDKDSLSNRDRSKGKIVEKFHSRRGCLMTLTFPEMDSVPDILTRPKTVPSKPEKVCCVITGKPARYRDPLSKLGYFDMVAFKELRRRKAANEPLDQRVKEKSPAASFEKPSEVKSDKSTPDKTQVATTNSMTKPATTSSAPQTPQSRGRDVTPNPVGTPPVPPVSPNGRRASPRSRKPSEKMLQTIVANQQKMRSTPGAAMNLVLPDTTVTSSIPRASVPTAKPAEIIDAKMTAAPKKSTAATATKMPRKAPTKSKPAASKGKGESNIAKVGSKRKRAPAKSVAKGAAISAKTVKPAGNGSKTAKTVLLGAAAPNQPAPAATAPLLSGTNRASNAIIGPIREQVYLVPREGAVPRDSPSPEKYITQSELIMQVINNYNKQHSETGE
jgi:vacuolar protein sorting-associated protein 72